MRSCARAVAVMLLCLVCAAVTTASHSASPGKTVRIGRLSPLSAESDVPNVDAFRKGLHELGWTDGRDVVIEMRFAGGNPDRLLALAQELVRERVDLILVGSTPGVLAAKKATGTIPIVMVTTGDPVAGGLVASLARPGGNVTGVTALGTMLNGKRLELLKEAVPGVGRVAVLANPTSPYTPPFLRERDSMARLLGIQLPVIEARDPAGLEPAFAALASERAGALMVLTDVMLISNRRRVVELVASTRLPAMYSEREFVEAGGLMFYGASLADMYHRAAFYADRILKGARPADLPIEQPTKLDLIVNLRTARALGLPMPRSILTKAEQVIE